MTENGTAKHGKRLPPTLRKELWRLVKAGQSVSDISRQLHVWPVAVYEQIQRAGGIAPRFGRRPDALTEAEREEISRCLARGWSQARIARELRRSPSTICRELKRNGGREGYRAMPAEQAAWRRARRPKQCKLAQHRRLRQAVIRKLKDLLSPQQIANQLRREYSDDPDMRISHETIYKSLFVQARGELKRELTACLRTGRKHRKAQGRSVKRVAIPDGISIRERPAEVEDRAVPGHWEGDLLFGDVHSYIATLVERTTRYCMLVRVKSKDPADLADALRKAICRLPEEVRKSLTWDRGAEMADHARFTVETNIPVYFCDPRSPWQRGSNENTNGLLRQYFPKGQSVAHIKQPTLDRVSRQLNRRPRMTLDWRTPAEALNELIALTA